VTIPSLKKEARGRKAAGSLEKTFNHIQKSEPAFSQQEIKDMRDDVQIRDDMRESDTKRSILNLRKKTLEYKAGKKKKKKKHGVVTEEDMLTKVIV